jgi:uncharacterized Zn finger protein (UPF0148 family)
MQEKECKKCRRKWTPASRMHNQVYCPTCAQDRRRARARANRREQKMVYESLGLQRVKGSLGGTYWE